jgi:transcriptional regulator with XRE-family HTH domain
MSRPADFAACLRRLREAQGLTQVQLALRAQLSPSAVCQWEQGRRLPSWEAAVALARALGVSLDALAG